jgi:hypothetical protein
MDHTDAKTFNKYHKITVPQLKALLKQHNIKVKRRANKETIVNALIDNKIF